MSRFYYWDDNKVSEINGFSLTTCLVRFGSEIVRRIDINGSMICYKVIYLSQEKTLESSWLLWFKKNDIYLDVCGQDYSKTFGKNPTLDNIIFQE